MSAPATAPRTAATRAHSSKNAPVLSGSCSPKTNMAVTHARNAAAHPPPKTHAIHFATRIADFIAPSPPNAKTQRRRATEQRMQTERATRRPLK